MTENEAIRNHKIAMRILEKRWEAREKQRAKKPIGNDLPKRAKEDETGCQKKE